MSVFDIFNRDEKVSPQLQRRRVNICMDCDHLIKATNQCNLCGCLVRKKCALKTEFCPDGKW